MVGAAMGVEGPGNSEQRPTGGESGTGLGGGIKPEARGLPRRWFQQAKQQVDGRGFARPIWSEKPKDDASRYLQREIIERFDCAKKAGKVFDMNNWFWHSHTTPCSPQCCIALVPGSSTRARS